MIETDKTIIVEGKHDKIKISSVISANIIETDGFSIFKDKEKLELIKKLADKNGIIIMTDSDAAGFRIRGYLNGIIPNSKITNIYIPDIFGKERRKRVPGKERKLGVEGMSEELLRKLLKDIPNGERKSDITVYDLYELGVNGGNGSARRRRKLLGDMGLPARLNNKRMCEMINALYTKEEFIREAERVLGIDKKDI